MPLSLREAFLLTSGGLELTLGAGQDESVPTGSCLGNSKSEIHRPQRGSFRKKYFIIKGFRESRKESRAQLKQGFPGTGNYQTANLGAFLGLMT